MHPCHILSEVGVHPMAFSWGIQSARTKQIMLLCHHHFSYPYLRGEHLNPASVPSHQESYDTAQVYAKEQLSFPNNGSIRACCLINEDKVGCSNNSSTLAGDVVIQVSQWTGVTMNRSTTNFQESQISGLLNTFAGNNDKRVQNCSPTSVTTKSKMRQGWAKI